MVILLIILIGLLSSSLVEYCLHRFYLHSNYMNPHIQIHHKDFNGDTSYENMNANFKIIASSKKYIMVNIIIYSPIGLIILLKNIELGIVYFIIAILYTLWVEFVHYYFHTGKKMFLNDFNFYKSIKEHHRIHHVLYDCNYGIGSSVWDVILKTKK